MRHCDSKHDFNTTNRVATIIWAAACASMAGTIRGQTALVPTMHQFTPNTPARAVEVNENFARLIGLLGGNLTGLHLAVGTIGRREIDPTVLAFSLGAGSVQSMHIAGGAILVVPEIAYAATASADPGRLGEPGEFRAFMGELLDALGAGHYGIFSGRRWREQVYPQVREFIAQYGGAPQRKSAAARKAKPKARRR